MSNTEPGFGDGGTGATSRLASAGAEVRPGIATPPNGVLVSDDGTGGSWRERPCIAGTGGMKSSSSFGGVGSLGAGAGGSGMVSSSGGAVRVGADMGGLDDRRRNWALRKLPGMLSSSPAL